MWKAHAAGALVKSPPSELEGRHGPPVRLQTAIEREHGTPALLGRQWQLPPALAARFTPAETAALAIGHIAALAGICPRSVRNAIRAAEVLGSSPSQLWEIAILARAALAVNDQVGLTAPPSLPETGSCLIAQR